MMPAFWMTAPGKVNLCLFLGGVREPDRRHRLVTVFQSLSLADRLHVEIGAAGVERDEVICPGVEGPNLAATALAALRDHGWSVPPVRILIDKQIPVAAGMAGGSADAAAVLRIATRHRPVPWGDVFDIAAELGADVPGQLDPGLALGIGAGEDVYRFPPLAEHAYLVLPSPQELSTAAVYREADRLELARPRDQLAALEQRVRAALAARGPFPPELIVNDLQPAALSLCPSIAAALEAALDAGADQAIVSGSGPTVVGIRWGEEAAGWAQAAAAALARSYPGAAAALPFTGP